MLTPHMIARIFDRSVAARLRGGVETFEPKGFLHPSGISVSGLHAEMFTDWLAGYWTPGRPTEPLRYPDAVSFLGTNSMERGPRWYAEGCAILGFLPNSHSGCYRIPTTATLPCAKGDFGRSPDPLAESWL